ncbi:hypothetical protein GCM10010504_40440 [Streptomyces griseus]|nr:hypothetical protein GCM10010504_40440 [Streptomyces griseus]
MDGPEVIRAPSDADAHPDEGRSGPKGTCARIHELPDQVRGDGRAPAATTPGTPVPATGRSPFPAMDAHAGRGREGCLSRWTHTVTCATRPRTSGNRAWPSA